jgi:acetolactate synthase-1/2/3 large subunit
MFNVQELATAVRHKIGLSIVVFNDGHYGNVKRMQEEGYEGRTIASDLVNPDFVKLAESFGARGVRAKNAVELRAALETSLAIADTPTVIEVPCGEFPSPWHWVIRSANRGG